MLYVGLTIKVKVGIPERFKVGWYPHKITGSSHLKVFVLLLIRPISEMVTFIQLFDFGDFFLTFAFANMIKIKYTQLLLV